MYPAPDSRNVLEPGCARCPELVESRERISWGNGSTVAEVMVVGEAPGAGRQSGENGDGETDPWRGGNYTGLAYTARHSGRTIRELFAEVGYGPGDLYVTNAVKCHPPGERDPTDAELETCFDHLRVELETVDPAVVAATGRHATRSLLEREGIAVDGFLDRVLDPVDCPGLGVTVLPLLHPAYQHVWIARLGYDAEGYRGAVAETLAALV